jgi:hypothetical protein
MRTLIELSAVAVTMALLGAHWATRRLTEGNGQRQIPDTGAEDEARLRKRSAAGPDSPPVRSRT